MHVGFTILIIYGSIYSLDGIAQHAEHFVLIVQIRNHVSGIDSGKGLVVGVFQQTGGTDSNRCLYRIEEGKEVFYQPVGQLGTKEGAENHVVGRITQGYLVQLVGVHELIENIGTEDYGFRNHDGGILKLIELRVTFYHVVNKGQTASFSSQ